MRFLLYFRFSNYLLIGSGYLALMVTGNYGIIAAGVFALILIAGWNIDAGRWTLNITPIWWNLATIAVLLLCVADALFLRHLQAVALVNFLVFLQVIKIMTPKRHRDYVLIYVISFFQLLISSIMTMSILFAVSCAVFAVAATWALITLHFKKEIEAHILKQPARQSAPLSPDEEQRLFANAALDGVLTPRFFSGTFGITLLTLGLAVVVFAVLPRVREGFFIRYGTDFAQRVSGFSEEVELDSFGTIRLDHQPVMRVTLPQITDRVQLPERLYWKGKTYNVYDGRRWRSAMMMQKRLFGQSQYRNMYWLRRQTATDTLLEQHIELAQPDFEVVFGAHQIQAVEGKFLSLQHDMTTGNTGVVFDPYAPVYTVYSDLVKPTVEDLRTEPAAYPATVAQLYLQVPELADRIHTLAEEIGGQEATAYDKVVAVQVFLMHNYTYSLDVQRSGDVPPLEDFLFVNQAGHCEYYATSMAILLRILGIPTRLVNGFAQGRWNEFGHFFTVRQSDAHAWVEVFFPSSGWVTFDPTPAVAFGDAYRQFAEQRGVLASLYRYSEYLRTSWNRYIVDYSREDQARAIVGAFVASHRARRNFRRSLRRFSERVKAVVGQISWRDIGLAVLLLGASSVLLSRLLRIFGSVHLRLPRLLRRKRGRQRQILRFYQTMLGVLAKKGVTRSASVTPGEFARLVARDHAACGQPVQEITELYYAVRYGQAEFTPADYTRVEQALRTLKSTTKECMQEGVV
jgi:protein-glutamine gamma-glutamyltransferase